MGGAARYWPENNGPLFFMGGRNSFTAMASIATSTMIVGALCLAPFSARGELTDVQQAIRESFPKYDPTASKAPPTPATNPARNRRSAGLVGAQPPKSKDKPALLPVFIVRSTSLAAPKAAAPLPRMIARPSFKDEPPDQFETPAARDERLVRNHLSEFDRYFLNGVTPFGITKEQRAREAEAIQRFAREIGAITELLEVDGADKAGTEEARKLREAIYDAYVSRPT
jgi:hypothetical protein